MQRGSLLGSLINGATGKKFNTPIQSFKPSNCFVAPQQQQPIQQQSIFSSLQQQQLQQQNKMEIPSENIIGEIELTAVPKKRVSYTRNRKRNSSKKYENIHNYTICQKCSSPKLRHNLCMTCLRKNSI